MGATRQNLQAQPKILKKIIGTSNQPIRTKNFLKKNYVSYLKSVKEPKIRMGATQRNLQAQPKILKKIIRTSSQSEQKFYQKKYVLYLNPLMHEISKFDEKMFFECIL
jgi:hypothetical protein